MKTLVQSNYTDTIIQSDTVSVEEVDKDKSLHRTKQKVNNIRFIVALGRGRMVQHQISAEEFNNIVKKIKEIEEPTSEPEYFDYGFPF